MLVESSVSVWRMFTAIAALYEDSEIASCGSSVASLRKPPPFAYNYRNHAAGTGNAVTDLIFSIAKRDVTFFNGTALISFL
jgi:hypothetical protein